MRWKSNAQRECALFLASCFAAGAIVGVVGVLWQLGVERRGR